MIYRNATCDVDCSIVSHELGWRWTVTLRHDLPKAEGYIVGQPSMIIGFSETRELAIDHVKASLHWALHPGGEANQ